MQRRQKVASVRLVRAANEADEVVVDGLEDQEEAGPAISTNPAVVVTTVVTGVVTVGTSALSYAERLLAQATGSPKVVMVAPMAEEEEAKVMPTAVVTPAATEATDVAAAVVPSIEVQALPAEAVSSPIAVMIVDAEPTTEAEQQFAVASPKWEWDLSEVSSLTDEAASPAACAAAATTAPATNDAIPVNEVLCEGDTTNTADAAATMAAGANELRADATDAGGANVDSAMSSIDIPPMPATAQPTGGAASAALAMLGGRASQSASPSVLSPSLTSAFIPAGNSPSGGMIQFVPGRSPPASLIAEGTYTLRILHVDTSELSRAVEEAREALVDHELVQRMEVRLKQAVAAQQKLSVGMSRFVSRLRARTAKRKRATAAAESLALARKGCEEEMAKLHEQRPRHSMLASYVEELERALQVATAEKMEVEDDMAYLAKARATSVLRTETSQSLSTSVDAATEATEKQ